MKINVLILLAALTISGCTSIKVSSIATNGESSYKELASSKLGVSDPIYLLSESNTYVLCIKDVKGTVQQPRNLLSFVVIKMDDNKVVLEENVEGGTVDWFSDNSIQVFRTPGIMRDDQTRDDFITLYNVETGISSKKKNSAQE